MASINQPLEARTEDLESEEIIPISHHPEIDPTTGKDRSKGGHQVEKHEIEIDRVDFPVVLYEDLMRVNRKQEPECEVVVGDKDNELSHMPSSTTHRRATRLYEVWPGKNVFFFRGRLICGPDPKGFLLTTISIFLSNWIFCIYIGHDIAKHAGLIITFSMILTAIVLVNLVMVSTRDPGIIPRNDHPPTEEIGTSDRVRSKRAIVNGVEMKLKYCRICLLFRPPRSCHCAVCDNCVEKFDHHCPWIGQCIGLRNYRFYLTFISSALVFFIYIFSFSCWRINRRMSRKGNGVFSILTNAPETFALATFSFVAIWFLGGLTTFHAHLITLNQTSYESFRQRYKGSTNPYDKGVLGNIKEVLLKKLPPSRVNFRAEVKSWWHFDDMIAAKKTDQSDFSNGEDEMESVGEQRVGSETKRCGSDRFEEVDFQD
ncbi:putative protein S-acyltransferase 1 [Tasmannia lanceolata]|uniref:putative protein S-acyltransferase 1 n=1 Tax=Tasmannia lanceolata TaxID=3420 RepID=UPI004062EBBF